MQAIFSMKQKYSSLEITDVAQSTLKQSILIF
jgi:hypothetical protein